MIIYNTKNWANSLWKIALSFDFRKGGNYTMLLIGQFIVVAYVTSITVVEIEFHDFNIHVEPMFFSLVGIIISLILVFRLNTAYDRWWEGRKQWGALVNNCRTLASNFHSLIPQDDLHTRKQLAEQISNFPFALDGHLRDKLNYSALEDVEDGYMEKLIKAVNTPHEIATQLFVKMEELRKNKVISDVDKLNLKPQIQALIDILGACERIKGTPIPFSHSSFIKSFIVIYILALPFGLIDTFLYFTIPAAALISYALVGVEVISEEIEDPFGSEANDLPLTYMATKIKEGVYCAFELECEVEYKLKNKKRGISIIY